ncbi:MAG: pyridoxamine 5'-phosphate oxidase family protein [Pseudomonadota bacterium]
MQDNRIKTETALEASIGKKSPAIDLKVIDRLDEGALQWLAACPLAFLGFGKKSGPVASIAGGDPGFIKGQDKTLIIPVSSIDNAFDVEVGDGFGSLYILPKLGEMLRINGKVTDCSDTDVSVAVEECFIHCAKALIRSDFWEPVEKGAEHFGSDPRVDSARFLALVTMDEKGNTDVSPKGDPSGMLAKSTTGGMWLAERPGNRRADSFRNILQQPRIGGVFIAPEANNVVQFTGSAQPTTDDVRADLAVKDKTPAVATLIEIDEIASYESNALLASRIWEHDQPDIKPAKILSAHIKLNKNLGLSARLVSTVSSVPGLLQKSLDDDYKKNLY